MLMYLYSTITNKKTILQQPIFRGKDKNKEIEKISEVQIWATSFNDIGDDYCELRVIGINGKLLKTEKVNGY